MRTTHVKGYTRKVHGKSTKVKPHTRRLKSNGVRIRTTTAEQTNRKLQRELKNGMYIYVQNDGDYIDIGKTDKRPKGIKLVDNLPYSPETIDRVLKDSKKYGNVVIRLDKNRVKVYTQMKASGIEMELLSPVISGAVEEILSKRR